MEKIGKSSEMYKFLKEMMKTGKPHGYTVTDDLQVLRIALDFHRTISHLYYTDTTYQEETLLLLNQLKNQAENVYEISEGTYESLALKENHAGIIGIIKMPQWNEEDFSKLDFLVVLDRLEIPGNVGTIYRTADAAAADGIIMTDSVTKYDSPKITSSSRGCNLILPTMQLTYEETLRFLSENGYHIYLGEPVLGKNYQEYDYEGKTAIVVGNERFGINKDWYAHESRNVFIPMEGHQNSLNVSVAASVLIYEAYMKRHQ